MAEYWDPEGLGLVEEEEKPIVEEVNSNEKPQEEVKKEKTLEISKKTNI